MKASGATSLTLRGRSSAILQAMSDVWRRLERARRARSLLFGALVYPRNFQNSSTSLSRLGSSVFAPSPALPSQPIDRLRQPQPSTGQRSFGACFDAAIIIMPPKSKSKTVR